MLFLKQYFI